MADLFDYLSTQGDLSFNDSKINEVDALILSLLPFVCFKELVSKDFSQTKTLKEVVQEYSIRKESINKDDKNFSFDENILNLIYKLSNTNRFSDILLCGYKCIHNKVIEEQFSAITIIFDLNKIFVSFGGTDDTLLGWKEDFNLLYMDTIPSQIESKKYLNKVLNYFEDSDIFVGGHSKGGNLSIYSSALVEKKKQKLIHTIYSFDAPGFSKQILQNENFKSTLNKTKIFYPQASIVGMLFYHSKNYFVVKSRGVLAIQHSPFTWIVDGKSFLLCPELDNSSRYFHKAFNSWLFDFTKEERKEFVDSIVEVFDSIGITIYDDSAIKWEKNSKIILKELFKLKLKTKRNVMKILLRYILLGKKRKPR